MGKKNLKRKRNEGAKEVVEDKAQPPPTKRHSDDPPLQKTKWTNKQRVLVLSSRGINHRDRHLMDDIKKLMPHHRPESKIERSKTLAVINEMCEMKNCNKAMLFEGRSSRDLYMWLANSPNGPSAKFLVESAYTMGELKLTGNCLRGSRPILSFDPSFKQLPHYKLLKELFGQIFGVPRYHPKSQPFVDHVYTFTILDNRIWFRNFQILSEDGALAEVGPRFVLNPVKIFSGSFGGATLWENPSYITPAKYRRQVLLSAKKSLYTNRKEQKAHKELTRPETSYKLKPLEDLFKGDPLEKVAELEAIENAERNNNEKTPKKDKKKKRGMKKKKGGDRAISNGGEATFQNGFEVVKEDNADMPRARNKKVAKKVIGSKLNKFKKQ